jgi:hypothetical protein
MTPLSPHAPPPPPPPPRPSAQVFRQTSNLAVARGGGGGGAARHAGYGDFVDYGDDEDAEGLLLAGGGLEGGEGEDEDVLLLEQVGAWGLGRPRHGSGGVGLVERRVDRAGAGLGRCVGFWCARVAWAGRWLGSALSS